MLEVENVILIPKKIGRLPFLGLSSIFEVQNGLFIPQIMARFLSPGLCSCVVVTAKFISRKIRK